MPGTYSQLAILAHKPIRAVADFQGQKIAVPGGAQSRSSRTGSSACCRYHCRSARRCRRCKTGPSTDCLPHSRSSSISDIRYCQIGDLYAGHYAARPGADQSAIPEIAGARIEAIVREEARKAEVVYTDWNIADNNRVEEAWRKNGGELITLPPAEAKRYLDVVEPATAQFLPPIRRSRKITKPCSRQRKSTGDRPRRRARASGSGSNFTGR